jgi:anti-sigma factor RsiW
MNNLILENDLELLSSYLDGQLSLSEIDQLKEHLKSDSAYQDAFEKMQRTRLILRSLPQRPIPHNFTLSPDLNKKKGYSSSFFQFFRFSSAVAALGLMILLVMDFFPFNRQPLLKS